MTTHGNARLALTLALTSASAQAQAPLPPPSQRQPQIIAERRHDDGRSERDNGLAALVARYLMGSLIVIGPALDTKNGREPLRHAGEKRLALIPVAGPMVRWFTARARLVRGGGGGFDGLMARGFHYLPGLPYACGACGAGYFPR